MTDAGEPILAGVELGGTKAIALVGRGREVIDRVTIPTTSPDATLAALSAALVKWRAEHRPVALGVASFGPIGLQPGHPDYGVMLATPKPGWAGARILAPLMEAAQVPALIHTDVTGAALAERRWGSGPDTGDLIYVTIGTGVGMGILANGVPVTGLMHPEAGHLRVRRMAGDAFPGNCPFHRDCLEGLVAGPAIERRAGKPGAQIADDDPLWPIVADALAEAFTALFMTLATGRILIGGSVAIHRPQLLPMIRAGVVAKSAGYLPFIDDQSIADRIGIATLAEHAGPLGALALADLARGQPSPG